MQKAWLSAGKLTPGSWADAILDAMDRGEVDQAVCPAMMIDYVGPSLGYDDLRDWQRSLAFRQASGRMAESS